MAAKSNPIPWKIIWPTSPSRPPWAQALLHISMGLFTLGLITSGLGSLLILWASLSSMEPMEQQPARSIACQHNADCQPIRFAVKIATPTAIITPSENRAVSLEQQTQAQYAPLSGNTKPIDTTGDQLLLPATETPTATPFCVTCLLRPIKEKARATASSLPSPTPITHLPSPTSQPKRQLPVATATPIPPQPTEPPPPPTTNETLAGAGCPGTSTRHFDAIPVERSLLDHPDHNHADLNLALRGYEPTQAAYKLVHYTGDIGLDSPQLRGMFIPHRGPELRSLYRINHWNWNCGETPRGCRGGPIEDWDVTLAGFATRPGEPLHIPERAADIYQGVFIALVLYASEHQITLGYTREDSVVSGYAVHMDGLCVDPNLLALYQAQVDANGWRKTNLLPALRNNEPLGTALGTEVRAMVRDRGSFLDPRSDKDWWQH